MKPSSVLLMYSEILRKKIYMSDKKLSAKSGTILEKYVYIFILRIKKIP